MRKWALVVGILAIVLWGNWEIWSILNRPVEPVPFTGQIRGVSFSPYQADQDLFKQQFPSAEQMDQDIQLLQEHHIGSLRTYTSLDGFEQIPALAAQHGIKVTAGAWLDRRSDRNEQEVRALIRNLRTYRNIDRAIVGNESLLRADMSIAGLTEYLRRVRALSPVPVSTAEPWHVWLKHPELVKEVDFIAVHLLPYWENYYADVPIERAIPFVMEKYEALHRAYPDKPILIAEVGWPSGGNRIGVGEASRVNQATFIRQFLSLAEAQGIDYFVMEAFDQPWKRQLEGPAGQYWGLWDAQRQPKFSLVEPVTENRLWPWEALAAMGFALLPMVLFLLRADHIKTRGQLLFATLVQAVASVFAFTLFVPVVEDLALLGQLVWGILLPAQLALFTVVLVNGLELVEMIFPAYWRRRHLPQQPIADFSPKVSIHLAIHNEPPEMVRHTLNALARLDYPDFEVLVIDNNTIDEAVWWPVEAHCAQLGPRFRFFHLPKWPGYKAGALNFGLTQTDPDAQVVGVIDSDYIVDPHWLKELIPYFVEQKVGFVQAPQDNREWSGDTFKTMMNWEYNGFFRIGMVQRNERNAIIQHGTMTLIRRAALEQLRWPEWCICEDAELGLRLFAAGYEAVYVDKDYGHGLTPDTFSGYKSQRFRWAFGAMQILRRHWRMMLPGRHSPLSGGQKFHFLTGWLPWIADGAQLLFTFAALLWTIGLVLAPQWFDFPLAAFLMPTIGMFVFKLVHALWLYQARVQCGGWERIGAAIAGMSLTHTIGRAAFQGLSGAAKPFFRTPKGEGRPALMQGLAQVQEEVKVLLTLWLAIAMVFTRYDFSHREAMVWVAVLAVQSVPYLAALFTSLVSTALPRLSRPAPVAVPAQG